MTAIDTYLHGLLAQAGFTQEDDLQALYDDLEKALIGRINAKVMEQIPSDKRDEAGDLLQDEDATKRESFVHKYIPEYDDFLASVLDEFADEYIDIMTGDDISLDDADENKQDK